MLESDEDKIDESSMQQQGERIQQHQHLAQDIGESQDLRHRHYCSSDIILLGMTIAFSCLLHAISCDGDDY